MSLQKLENDFAIFKIIDGFLHFIYKPDAQIALDSAKVIVSDRLKLQGERAYHVVCDIRGMKGMDKKARDYLANEGSQQVESVALIVETPALQIMTNFYLKVNKPKVPTQIFTSEEKAFEHIKKVIASK